MFCLSLSLPVPLCSKEILHSLFPVVDYHPTDYRLLKITAIMPELSFVISGAELIRAPHSDYANVSFVFPFVVISVSLPVLSRGFLPFSHVQYHQLYQKIRWSFSSVWEPHLSFICIPFSIFFIFVIYMVEESVVIFCDILWIPWW